MWDDPGSNRVRSDVHFRPDGDGTLTATLDD